LAHRDVMRMCHSAGLSVGSAASGAQAASRANRPKRHLSCLAGGR